MYKEIAYYNDDGEKIWNHTSSFKGRFNDDRGYSLYAHGKTINSRKTVDFPSEMNKLQIANMMLLSKHLKADTNVLVYRTNKGDAPMTIKHIGNVIGTQDKQTRRFIGKMIQLQLMSRHVAMTMERNKIHKEIQYIINPMYFMNGKTISIHLYEIFRGSMDKHLPTWVVDKYQKRMEGQA